MNLVSLRVTFGESERSHLVLKPELWAQHSFLNRQPCCGDIIQLLGLGVLNLTAGMDESYCESDSFSYIYPSKEVCREDTSLLSKYSGISVFPGHKCI